MTVQHGIWKIGNKPQALKPIQLDSEELLGQQIFKDVSILNQSWLLIGRQVYTDFGKYVVCFFTWSMTVLPAAEKARKCPVI